ncbi:MAG: DUF2993 domain-containing protein [Firmicutes bacterium]|nr:DUF2993 domain-containing protein [Bacillota bacterium]
MREIIWAIVIALVLAVLTQFLLPPVLENQVEQALKERLREVEYLEVDIQAWPAVASLVGRLHSVYIEARDFLIDDLPVGAFIVQGRRVSLNPGALYRNGELLLDNAADLRLTVLFTEDGINRYFWEKVDPGKKFSIKLKADGTVLQGTLAVLGQELDVNLQGVFEVRDGTRIVFIPKALTVEQLQIPQFLLQSLVEDKALIIDLAGLPVSLVVDEIRLAEGQLYAFGHYEK